MSLDLNQEYPDVMVDIETTGRNFGVNAIIQIAAVKFNLRDNTVCPIFFNKCLMIPPNRYWCEDTRNWWLKSPEMRETLQWILGQGQHHVQVLQEFAAWAPQNARFWGKPTHFDYAFLQHYFEGYGLTMPFFFRDAENMHSWIRGRYWPEEAPNFEKEIEFMGSAHNALDDALHQVRALFLARDRTKNQLLVP